MAQEVLGTGIFEIGFKGDDAAVNTFKNSMSQLNGPARQVGLAFKNVNNGAQKLTFNLKQASTATRSLSSSLNSFAKEMFFTATAIGAVNAALLGLNKSVAETAFGFDRNMTLIKAVTNASLGEFDKLGNMAREMGADTEFGAAKAAEGLLVLSRMGLSAAESMEVLEPAMKLAQSQQSGLKETTELVISQLRVFGKTVDDSSKFANVLAATSSKSAADLEKLSGALSFVGPVANAAGRSFEEVNATLGLMFNAGIRASRAGTALRFAFANLMNPTRRVEKALKAMGLGINDLNPNMKTMNEIFVTLANRLDGVQDKATVMFGLFGKRAAPAMGAVVNEVIRNRDAFTEMEEAITNTNEVQRQFETQMASFSGAVLDLRSNWEEVKLQLVDQLLPVMRLMVDALKGLTKWFSNLDDGTKKSIGFLLQTATVATTLATAFTGLGWVVGMIGKSLITMSRGFSGLITGILGAKTATLGLGTAMKGLSASMGGPVGIIATLATISLPLLLSRMASVKAAEEEHKRVTKERVLALKDLIKELDSVRDSLGELEGKQNDVNQSTREAEKNAKKLEDLSTRERDAILEISNVLPKAVIGWDNHKKQLILNEEMVRKYQTANEYLLKSLENIESFKAKTREEEIQAIQAELSSIHLKIQMEEQVLRIRNEQFLAKKKELELAQQPINISEQTSASLFASTGTIEKTSNVNRLKREMKELDDAIVSTSKTMQELAKTDKELGDKLERLKNVAKGASKSLLKLGDDAEGSAEQAKRSFSSLLNMLEKLREKASQFLEKTELETKVVNANDVEKELLKIEQKFQKMSHNVEKMSSEAGEKFLKVLEGYNNGVYDDEQLKKAQDAYEDTITVVLRVTDKINILNKAMLKSWKKEYAEKLAKEDKALSKKILDSQYNIEKRRKDSLSRMNEDSRIAYEEQAAVIKEAAKEIEKDFLSAGIDDKTLARQQNLYNKMIALLSQYYEEYLAEVRSNEIEVAKIRHDQNIKSMSDFTPLKKARENYRGLLEIHNEIVREYGADSERAQASLQDLTDAQRNYGNQAKDTIVEIGEATGTALKDIMEAYGKETGKAFEIVGGFYKGIAQNPTVVGLFISAIKTGVAAIRDVAEAAEEMQEERKQQEAEYQSAQKALIDSTYELQRSFLELGRTMISAGTSAEEVEMALEAASEELLKQADAGVGSSALFDVLKQFTATATERLISDPEMRKILNLAATTSSSYADLGITRESTGSGYLDRTVTYKTDKTQHQDLVDLLNEISSGIDKQAKGDILETIGIKNIKKIDELIKAATVTLSEQLYKPLEGMEATTSNVLQLLSGRDEQSVAFRTFLGQLESFRAFSSVKPSTDGTVSRSTRSSLSLPESKSILSVEQLSAMKDVSALLSIQRDREALFGGLEDLFAKDELTNEDILSELVRIKEAFKDVVGETVTVGDKKFSVATADELLSAVNRAFSKGLELADTEEDIRNVFSTFKKDLEFLVTSGEGRIFRQLSPTEQLDLSETILEIPEKMEEAIEKLKSGLFDAQSRAIETAARNISQSFADGLITFDESLKALSELSSRLNEFPPEVAKVLENSISEARLSVLEGLKAKEAATSESLTSIGEIQSDYLSALEAIDEKTKDVINTWNDLLQERKTVVDEFIKDSEKLQKESDERIASLEKERSAILGTFSFAEGQSVRSKRFQEASEVELSIADERKELEKDLNKLTEEYNESLKRVNESLKELTDEYVSQSNIFRSIEQEKAAAAREYYDLLLKEKEALEDIGIAMEAQGTHVHSFAESLKDIIESFQSEIPNNLASQIDALNASILEYKRSVLDETLEAQRKVVNVSTIQSPLSQAPTFSIAPKASAPRLSPSTPQNPPMPSPKVNPFQNAIYLAQHGFQGIVRKPTTFVTGENNRPEFVNVTPMTGISEHADSMKGSPTIIAITENIDLRGAYGITSPQVAQRVWDSVWAPARRKTVNRVLDMRGKVQR